MDCGPTSHITRHPTTEVVCEDVHVVLVKSGVWRILDISVRFCVKSEFEVNILGCWGPRAKI